MVQEDANETRELVARARQGDEAAMGRLLTIHADRLLAAVRAELGGRLRQRMESQDIMQQVCVDALRNIDSFVDQGKDSFFRWLRRIAVNSICDADRKAFQAVKRRGELRAADVAQADESILNLIELIPGSVTGPVTTADRADRLRMLRAALDGLSEDHREVLRLRYLNQLSFEETAAEMDKTVRAVRSLCVRALIRLKELLGDAI